MKINKVLLVKAFLIAAGVFSAGAMNKANASMIEELNKDGELLSVKMDNQSSFDVAWRFCCGRQHDGDDAS